MIFFHFKFWQANLRDGKGDAFMVSPGRHLTSLRCCYHESDILQTHVVCTLATRTALIITILYLLFQIVATRRICRPTSRQTLLCCLHLFYLGTLSHAHSLKTSFVYFGKSVAFIVPFSAGYLRKSTEF